MDDDWMLLAIDEIEVQFSHSRCEVRLGSYKDKYGLATNAFLAKTTGDELQHADDFDDWIGESRMLARLRAKLARLQSAVHQSPL